MPGVFRPSAEVRKIRSRLEHPVVDGDGHLIEVFPLVVDFVSEVADASVAQRMEAYYRERSSRAPGYLKVATHRASLPNRNTLDRMTATFPDLLAARLDELGVDFALLYPTSGLVAMQIPDPEVRQAAVRGFNRYYAEVFADHRRQLEPVAVIPTFTPEEALAELDVAVGEWGLKAIVMTGVVPRSVRPDGSAGMWIDTLGHGSPYDYDPVWARCIELGVVPAFHGIGYGWGSRTSPTNYVYNHLGSFGVAQEAACRSLLMGGVPRRFPELRAAFLEGGVTWALQLYADFLGHFAKRNRDAIADFDPVNFDLALAAELFERYGRGRVLDHRDRYLENARQLAASCLEQGPPFDEFAESRIESPEEAAEIFSTQFYFGCEADDPMNALAFDRTVVPRGIELNAMFASDIGHWDVPDFREVLCEAWELVEHGHLDMQAFRAFSFGNVVRMLTSMNPAFFDGTAVESEVREEVATHASG